MTLLEVGTPGLYLDAQQPGVRPAVVSAFDVDVDAVVRSLRLAGIPAELLRTSF